MQLSSESPRVRHIVMVAILALSAVLVVLHAKAMRSYLDTAGGLGLRGAQPSTPLVQIYPAFAADAQTWVRHALSLLEGDQVQLRWTMIDNAPDGREVHWNSAWAWTIALAGEMDHWLTNTPVPYAVERMTVWLPGIVLIVLTSIIGTWVARKAGALAGVIVVMGIIGHARIYEGFFPSYVDHHGLLTMAVVGLALGAIVMGGGWWAPEGKPESTFLPRSLQAARSAAIFSAVSGALGLWVSAASVIAPIGIIGLGAAVVLALRGDAALKDGAQFDPETWRIWGRVGAIGSVFFYLVEYFPMHLGLRLEANHPFYALAWWGGGEFLAQMGEWWLGGSRNVRKLLPSALIPLAAIAVAPVTILLGGTSVFVVSDRFLATLHHDYIAEFLPMWRTLQGRGWHSFFELVGTENLPLLVGLGLVVIRGRSLPLSIWYGVVAAVGFTAMAWAQSRWLLNASGSQVALALVLLAWFLAGHRRTARWMIGVAVAGLIFYYPAISRVTDAYRDLEAHRVGPKDAANALARDIAKAIRDSQPDGRIALLTNPNSSTNIGYYGRFQTVGTLYWENVEGLKTAAEIFSATNNRDAAILLREHRITHIAIVSEENFIGPFFQLLHPKATEADVKRCFGYQIFVNHAIPQWLEMIPYRVPDDLKSLNISVMLFKVNFSQTAADALYHVALGKIELGLIADAEQDLDELIRVSPQSQLPWLRKGELLFTRKDFENAAKALLKGISLAPAQERVNMWTSAAGSFYREHRYAEAIAIYRIALTDHYDPTIASYLAFILATTSNDALRNGKEALALAERAVETNSNSPTYLNALAAALAENGRFAEAVTTVERAIANAHVQGDVAAEQMSRQRLAAYRAGKPWRE